MTYALWNYFTGYKIIHRFSKTKQMVVESELMRASPTNECEYTINEERQVIYYLWPYVNVMSSHKHLNSNITNAL